MELFLIIVMLVLELAPAMRIPTALQEAGHQDPQETEIRETGTCLIISELLFD